MPGHRGQYVFGLAVGLLVALASYHWITDPGRRDERLAESAAVASARALLKHASHGQYLEVVDPLAPDRKVGKSYVYRQGDGWQVSGYYRRSGDDRWHPFLMTLDAASRMTHLKVQDAALAAAAADDPRLEVVP